MGLLTILGIALVVAAIGAIIYLGIRLTISVLRKHRSRAGTEFLIYDSNEMIKHLNNKDGHRVSAADLDPVGCGQYAKEFDPNTGEVLNTFACDQGMDERIDDAVKSHDGYIIVENL